MPITPGTRIGQYEIVAPIGAGGMGEVYRARDAALGRDVAIKVLPAAFAHDEDRLRRFVQEAQAAAALNHPNILAIHQIGQHAGAPFIVSELLEGETLRDHLHGGALVPRKAIDYAVQAARGLAAAHEKGIVHRDLKPENLFVTHDGRVKILDFGIAKLTRPDGDARDADNATRSIQTEAGSVLGTMGYMSPEQVRGQTVDARADIFSLGAILYEMLSGKRAFKKDTAADTMTAVLREDPPELSAADRHLPPVLERIVKRCLEKNAHERFQSARDLAFALEDVSSISTGHVPAAEPAASRSRKPALVGGAIALLLFGALAGIAWRARSTPASSQPVYQRLTFRRGTILTARFAPDGKTVLYGAAWDGKPPETFAVTPESPESRALGIAKSDIYSVSSKGELAISLRNRAPFPPVAGVLAQVPMLGGAAPREVLQNVEYADWGPDGSLAVTLDTGVGDRLEYPIGTMVYETPGPIHQLRISPDGSTVAFQEVVKGLSAIAVVDKAKNKRTLSSGWLSVGGLDWTPDGREIWFAGHRKDGGFGVFAVAPGGSERLLLRTSGPTRLDDIASDGRLLLTTETNQMGIRYLAPGADHEEDLSWLDRSSLSDLSPDGKLILFSELGEAGGSDGAVYLRKTDGSPAIRLGSGIGMALSPDATMALTASRSLADLNRLPTGAGQPTRLKGTFVRYWNSAKFLPDGKRVMFQGMEAQHDPRVYVQDPSGDPRAISPEGLLSNSILSTDGTRAAVVVNGKGYLLSTAGGSPQPISSIGRGDYPLTWTTDDKSILVATTDESGEIAAHVSRVDLATGTRTPWRTLFPTDAAGVVSIPRISVTPDLRAYAYCYTRVVSELYLVSGVR